MTSKSFFQREPTNCLNLAVRSGMSRMTQSTTEPTFTGSIFPLGFFKKVFI